MEQPTKPPALNPLYFAHQTCGKIEVSQRASEIPISQFLPRHMGLAHRFVYKFIAAGEYSPPYSLP
jgi:hypothetical protein